MQRSVLGKGIYGLREAARLLGVNRARLAAWYQGWPRRRGPLLVSEYRGMFSRTTISFLDLMDAAVAVTLRDKHGVSAETVRKLRERLKRDWNTAHPFSRQEFYTDDTGRQVFCRLVQESGESRFLEILRQQYAMPEVLLPFLQRVEYSEETRLAEVFRLTERVILDPRRKYGKPVVRGTGMPTAVLYECYQATGSADAVADWYNVTPEDVEAAVQFETEFSGIAA